MKVRTALHYRTFTEHTSSARVRALQMMGDTLFVQGISVLEVKAEDINIEGMPTVQCRQNVWKSCFMSAYIIFLYLKRLIIHIVCTVS